MKKLTLAIALCVMSGFAAAECPEWSAYQIGFLCDPIAAWKNRGETKTAARSTRQLNANVQVRQRWQDKRVGRARWPGSQADTP